jgi:hypothetical protein
MSQQLPEKVSVDVIERDQQFFADVGFNESKHSLGPTKSRDEIYSLIFGFISDLKLVAELERKRNQS